MKHVAFGLLALLLLAGSAQAQTPLDELKALRATFPTPLGTQGGALVNALAWPHRGEQWGLQRKDNSPCHQPTTDIPVSCDILRIGNTGRDVLGDSEGAGIPQWAAPGPADPATFVAPVDPGASHEPPPPPPDLTAVLTKLDALQRQLDAATEHIVALVAESAILEDKLNALLEKPGATCPAVVFPTYSGRLGMVLRLTPDQAK